MKRKLSLLVLVLFTAIVSSSFTVKNNISTPAVNNFNNMKVAIGGDWFIGYYFNGKTDMTGTVGAYTFTFNADGSVFIQRGEAVGVPGQYSNSGGTMSLGFYENDLAPLNGDWKILSNTDNEIRLARDNSQLDFVRNPNPGNPAGFQ